MQSALPCKDYSGYSLFDGEIAAGEYNGKTDKSKLVGFLAEKQRFELWRRF